MQLVNDSFKALNSARNGVVNFAEINNVKVAATRIKQAMASVKSTTLRSLRPNSLKATIKLPPRKPLCRRTEQKPIAEATTTTCFKRVVDLMRCDMADATAETASVHYTREIIDNLMRGERKYGPVGDYLAADFCVISKEMRAVLCDWLVDVHNLFQLRDATLYLCFNLLDRYLAKARVRRGELQLVGCACLWLASKYHEINTPLVDDFIIVSNNAFTASQLLHCESLVATTLDFALTVPTPLPFAQRFTKFATWQLEDECDKRLLANLILFVLERAMLDYNLATAYLPSQLAAAVVCFSVCATKIVTHHKTWDCFFAEDYGIGLTYEVLLPILLKLHAIVNKKDTGLNATLNKFKSPTRGKVAVFSFKHLDLSKV